MEEELDDERPIVVQWCSKLLIVNYSCFHGLLSDFGILGQISAVPASATVAMRGIISGFQPEPPQERASPFFIGRAVRWMKGKPTGIERLDYRMGRHGDARCIPAFDENHMGIFCLRRVRWRTARFPSAGRGAVSNFVSESFGHPFFPHSFSRCNITMDLLTD